MDRTRRHAEVLVVGLLCLPVAALGATSAGNPAGWHASENPDAKWFGLGPGTDQGRPVRITGELRAPLTPGIVTSIDLRFMNPNSRAVTVRRVRVTVLRLKAPHADATHQCTRRDFGIRQMPHLTLRIPAGRVVHLSGLQVPQHQWPTFGMLNRPVNQDGCKGARVTLGYGAYAPRAAQWPA